MINAPYAYQAFGLMNEQGEEIVGAVYGFIRPFTQKRAACMKEGKYGYIDNDGKEITSFRYDKAMFFDENQLAEVVLAGKVGYINKSGREVIPLEFEKIEPYDGNSECYLVKKGLYGVLNKSGSKILPVKFEDIKTKLMLKRNYLFRNGR